MDAKVIEGSTVTQMFQISRWHLPNPYDISQIIGTLHFRLTQWFITSTYKQLPVGLSLMLTVIPSVDKRLNEKTRKPNNP